MLVSCRTFRMKYIAYITTFYLIIISNNLYSQLKITGQVFNDNNEPLIGASIFLKDTKYATITDDSGQFKLDQLREGEYTFLCTHLGYDRYSKVIRLNENVNLDILMDGFTYDIEAINITSNRLEESSPFSYTTMSKEEIQDLNLGQDVPFLLQYTPSVVVTSDAGAGVGYTGMRIRGSDPTRVNVTINGIPLNDSESQGVFWVDLPDFGSSISDIQLQRGVGTSTNGTGAFGATLALNTKKIYQNNYVELNAGYGSFDTKKLSLSLGTGLLNNSFYVDGRFSFITSDGFIDRASSNLRAYNISAGKLTNNGSIRLDYFYGKERTYQAWYGVPQAKFEGDEEASLSHFYNNYFEGGLYETVEDSLNYFNSDERFNYYLYDDQVDDYKQEHVQFHWDHKLREDITANVSLHYTKGFGFFEQFKYNEDLEDYDGLLMTLESMYNSAPSSSSLVRRRILDNDFVGGIANLKWNTTENVSLHWGGSYSFYLGRHYGQVRDVLLDPPIETSHEYYYNEGKKNDVNTFLKLNWEISKLSLYGDIQYRGVSYTVDGTDNDGLTHAVDDQLNFINPKVGLTYRFTDRIQAYGSMAVAHREPDRNDYTSQINTLPQSEKLTDYELGLRMKTKQWHNEVNLYYMDYKDQLVITGALNDVGANLRANVPKSHRAGIELLSIWKISDKFTFDINATLSENKIEVFNEVLYDYTYDFDIIENEFEDTDIALSPNVIGAAGLAFRPIQNLEIKWQSKFVGDQFLDNTSNESRKLDSYFLNNLIASYSPKQKIFSNIRLNLLVNNLFNVKYAPNGYTYSYYFYDLITENFVYPQAGINFLVGLSIRM